MDKWNVADTPKTVAYVSSASRQVSKAAVKDLAGSKDTVEYCTFEEFFDSLMPNFRICFKNVFAEKYTPAAVQNTVNDVLPM